MTYQARLLLPHQITKGVVAGFDRAESEATRGDAEVKNPTTVDAKWMVKWLAKFDETA
ncbi:hypothetical protein AAIB41_01140 [Brucella sp. BE17]|uniref:hypothetical protein n=1 Tax=Brucella sp. BE17 TaxID=3142977 RepID=UPI0031BAFD6C